MAAALVFGPAAVASASPDAGSEPLRVAGASTIQPVLEDLADDYLARTGRALQAKGGGAREALRLLRAGEVDVAAISRAPTDEEAEEFAHAVIGMDGLAVVVHRDNPVRSLSHRELRMIFSGGTRRWEGGWPGADTAIVISRHPGRASRAHFAAFLWPEAEPGRAADNFHSDAWAAEANLDVLLWVGGLPSAIGFVSAGEAHRLSGMGMPVRAIAIDGVAPTVENLRNGSYPLVRRLTLLFGPECRYGRELADLALSAKGAETLLSYGFCPPDRDP
ncbi:MAG: substrate-binding domain-containing protein [Puniceicoccaceae bacterium]